MKQGTLLLRQSIRYNVDTGVMSGMTAYVQHTHSTSFRDS